ncbi:MAG TPA: F0F1 ATP synthase subunit epsilon [Steroidobacteraceae bacterium]
MAESNTKVDADTRVDSNTKVDSNTIRVEIVSAEGELFSGAAAMVFAPGEIGDLGILPRHAALLSLLKAGEVRVRTPDGAEQSFFVGGGVIEVQPNKVTVLADTAARAKDLDEAAALEAKQRAEEALRDKTGHIDQAHALAELARAAAQLKLIERLRKLRS